MWNRGPFLQEWYTLFNSWPNCAINVGDERATIISLFLPRSLALALSNLSFFNLSCLLPSYHEIRIARRFEIGFRLLISIGMAHSGEDFVSNLSATTTFKVNLEDWIHVCVCLSYFPRPAGRNVSMITRSTKTKVFHQLFHLFHFLEPQSRDARKSLKVMLSCASSLDGP